LRSYEETKSSDTRGSPSKEDIMECSCEQTCVSGAWVSMR